jgi:hypothetical protein
MGGHSQHKPVEIDVNSLGNSRFVQGLLIEPLTGRKKVLMDEVWKTMPCVYKPLFPL